MRISKGCGRNTEIGIALVRAKHEQRSQIERILCLYREKRSENDYGTFEALNV